MEQVIVVNEKDEILGTMPKSEAHKNGTLHRITVVYIENDKGEFLVQERVDGYLDHSAAGHVMVGESYEEAAKRELFEELGIKADTLKYIGHGVTHNEIYPDRISSHIFDIFCYKAEPGALQKEEVKGVYWAMADQVLKDMQLNDAKYCEGFKVSLPVFQTYQQKQ